MNINKLNSQLAYDFRTFAEQNWKFFGQMNLEEFALEAIECIERDWAEGKNGVFDIPAVATNSGKTVVFHAELGAY